ncbi:PREDICTED: uncharacterized protein LOC106742915 [Dinoponera quadriceps]|uniref:Uncharacterized protein LOC106742915 n=1 Tax=Dinoponera quadriceps TaxID=609295 RepID=A0A6P3X1K0_DINQU|nr:PREDICTED: uncharacterized protein LOC106742915 [Dinoponera quadriceps]
MIALFKRQVQYHAETENMGKKSRITAGGSTESGNVYLFRNMGSFEIFTDDASQAVLCNTQPTRNLPNILRSSNARAYKNDKTFMLDQEDIAFVSIAESANTFFDLNIGVDSEKDSKYNNKIGSPKSQHQRKQVHHPLDTRYDVPDWCNNNNNNKNNKDNYVLQTVDELGTIYVTLSHEEENSPTKKMNVAHNSEEHRYLFKKPKGSATRKSSDRKAAKLPGFRATVAADANTTDKAAASSDTKKSFLGDDVLPGVIETKSSEGSDIFHRNGDIRNLDGKYNANYSHVTSGKSTECDATQQVASEKDPLSYEFSSREDVASEEDLINKNRSNFLFASEVLCTCTCENCTFSSEKDFVLYEDSVPNYANSDAESEHLTPCSYDFYTNDYYHVLGDVDDFDKTIFCYKEPEDTNVTKWSACDGNSVGNGGVEKSIESNANEPTSVKQRESKDSQAPRADRTQKLRVESCSAELVVHSDERGRSTGPSKSTVENAENHDDTDDYVRFKRDSVSAKKSKAISPNQATTSTNVAVLDPTVKNQTRRTKKDICVIQCTRCERVFSEKKFRKHFTYCSFYKENFKCHICGKVYRYKSSLVHHLKTAHHMSYGPYEQYYVCSRCGKLYVRFRAFQRHMLIHNINKSTTEHDSLFLT